MPIELLIKSVSWNDLFGIRKCNNSKKIEDITDNVSNGYASGGEESVKSDKSNKEEFNKSILKKELEELINAGLSLSAASKYLAKKKKLKRNSIYNLYQ